MRFLDGLGHIDRATRRLRTVVYQIARRPPSDGGATVTRASLTILTMLIAGTALTASGPIHSPESAQPLIQQHDTTASLLQIERKAWDDFTILQGLVADAQTRTMLNPADHKAYPLAPEYADRFVGIGAAAAQLSAASTTEQYHSADSEITSLTMALRAQLDDRADTTPHNQPHRTDQRLMSYYGVAGGRAAIISLAEQTARFYENGTLVYWSFVTTGRPEQPSAPGYHIAGWHASPTRFVSPDPPGSPEWFAPTPIHYAVEYNTGGYFLHDAWWRHQFGPFTNLPHHDPAAFNGGSLGCINFPLATMPWVYQWLLPGTPIIVY